MLHAPVWILFWCSMGICNASPGCSYVEVFLLVWDFYLALSFVVLASQWVKRTPKYGGFCLAFCTVKIYPISCDLSQSSLELIFQDFFFFKESQDFSLLSLFYKSHEKPSHAPFKNVGFSDLASSFWYIWSKFGGGREVTFGTLFFLFLSWPQINTIFFFITFWK